MCLYEPLQVAAAGRLDEWKALVDQSIVENCVEQAVDERAESDPPQGRPAGSGDEKPKAHATKYQRIEIVALEHPAARLMVRSMPAPARTVHQIAVYGGGDKLHANHSQQHDQQRDQPVVHASQIGAGGRHVHAAKGGKVRSATSGQTKSQCKTVHAVPQSRSASDHRRTGGQDDHHSGGRAPRPVASPSSRRSASALHRAQPGRSLASPCHSRTSSPS